MGGSLAAVEGAVSGALGGSFEVSLAGGLAGSFEVVEVPGTGGVYFCGDFFIAVCFGGDFGFFAVVVDGGAGFVEDVFSGDVVVVVGGLA